MNLNRRAFLGHGITGLTGFATLTLAALVLPTSGCHAGRSSRSTLAADPAWRVRQGQAVWRPRRDAPEITGELLLAAGKPDSGFLLEFSKPALPMVRVIRRPKGWEISATGRGTYRGRHAPPRLAWFQLGRLLYGEPLAQEWEGARGDLDSGGIWWLENRRTGERLEGFFNP